MTSPQGRSSRWGDEQRELEHRLLAEFTELPEGDPRRSEIRDQLVTMHLPLVQHIARRYRDRGEPMDDLVQVATIGLIKAVDRFDPTRGAEFSTYATPTIIGEIKRHFRDRTWALKVPRRLQELSRQVAEQSDELGKTLRRSPTVRELAAAMEVGEQDILDALEARYAYATTSLDADRSDDSDGSHSLSDSMGLDDPAFAALEDREGLRPLLEALPERERRIIVLRFFANQSQSQIAEELGISQMHVSRLLARTLFSLRSELAQT